MSNYAIIILAAGASSRLGQAKQLVPYKGRTLLQYTLDIAMASGIGPVYIVLGSEAEGIKKKLHSEGYDPNYIHNEEWPKGMGSSIAAGVANMPSHIEGVLLLQCDQPFIDVELLKGIKTAAFILSKGIVLSDYGKGQGFGPPTYFSQKYFERLKTLNGSNGAKAIIKNNTQHTAYYSFPKGRFDIDYPEDLEKLK